MSKFVSLLLKMLAEFGKMIAQTPHGVSLEPRVVLTVLAIALIEYGLQASLQHNRK